jgi:hypothetical protein
MFETDVSMRSNPIKSAVLCLVVGFAVTILVAGTMVLMAPRPAQALPKFAAQTGLPCGRCHVNPAGGGPRNAFGKAFQENGFKVPAKKK